MRTARSVRGPAGADKRILVLVLSVAAVTVFLGLPLAWHLYLAVGMEGRMGSMKSTEAATNQKTKISVNPVTNIVTMTIEMAPELDQGSPFAALGSALGETMIQTLGPKVIEPQMNTWAREQYDVYAMFVPYRVRVSTIPASPEAVTQLRAEREKRRAEEAREKAKAEADRLQRIRDYVSASLSLVNVRVAPGERFGRTVAGVFGSIVNNGTRTLRKVTVRFYFLDSAGRRIGEKDFSPVLVTELSIGDNTPLRPGYRKDFGYNVEEDAPSGWSKRVEAEIVDLDFGDD